MPWVLVRLVGSQGFRSRARVAGSLRVPSCLSGEPSVGQFLDLEF